MLFGGIDPGKEGALALLDEGGRILRLKATPMFATLNGRPDYDLVAIRAMLREWMSGPDGDLHLTIERLQALPPRGFGKGGTGVGGSAANFARGLAHGWRWMAVGLGIPCLMVSPQVWQREMLGGHPSEDTKARSLRAAAALWPGVNLLRTLRSRVPSDALSDALLLAEYGRRQRLGGAVFATAERKAGA